MRVDLFSEYPGEMTDLYDQVKVLQDNFFQLKGQYEELARTNGVSPETLAQQLSQVYRGVMDVMHLRIEMIVARNTSATIRESIAKYYRHELGALRGMVFKSKMKEITGRARKFNAIPFAYYDFYDSNVVYTPAIPQVLGLEKITEQLSLHELIDHVDKSQRAEVIKSFRNGSSLVDYELNLTGSAHKRVKVTSYPLKFRDETVGVGLVLDSPETPINRALLYLFGQEIKKGLSEVNKQFTAINGF